MPQIPTLRPGTFDEVAWDTTYFRNEYGFPPDMRDHVVIDVGAHVGGSTRACLDRGARWVFAYEPDPDNVALLRSNCSEHDNVQINHAAVWRSDCHVDTIRFHYGAHTGAGGSFDGPISNWNTNSIPVPAVKLDDIIRDVRGQFPNNYLWLKMDCEGAEFPILLTSTRLRDINRIVGEYHLFYPRISGLPPFTIKTLADCLERSGKKWTIAEAEDLGAFQAE